MAICTRTLSGAHRCVGNVVGKSGFSVRIEGQCPRCQQESNGELYAVPHGESSQDLSKYVLIVSI